MFPRDQARGKHLLLKMQDGYPFTLQQGSVVDLLGSMSSYNHDLRGHSERACKGCTPSPSGLSCRATTTT